MKSELTISNLKVNVEGAEILKGTNLNIKQGEIHALMGPNGSGKSTLAYTLMGHPKYEVTGGKINIDNDDILKLTPDERAQKGIFLAFQYPVEVSGVSLFNFLRMAYNGIKKIDTTDKGADYLSTIKFKEILSERLKLLKMDDSFITRNLNEGFSGGEKKKCEILQLAVLKPKFAILDETDSGLDIDALRIVAEGVNALSEDPDYDSGILIVTHYSRILKYIKPDKVHVLLNGEIVVTGGEELSDELEKNGYASIEQQYGKKIK
jgi:Fe-S cluster assembly ATP-binding protein